MIASEQMKTLSSREFLKFLEEHSWKANDWVVSAAFRGEITRESIFRQLEKSRHGTGVEMLCCIDIILTQRKAVKVLKQLIANLAAFLRAHPSCVPSIVFATRGLGADLEGRPIENVLRNQFLVVVRWIAGN